jgi:hypothetical protein
MRPSSQFEFETPALNDIFMFSIVLNLFKFYKQNSIPGVQVVSRAQIQHSGSHDEKSFSKNQPGDYFKY